MRLQILHVPGCPNTGVLLARLDQTLATCGSVEVEVTVIHDPREASDSGMIGSPTLLVDGVDPFAPGDRPPSLSCRLYIDEHGTVSGAPSLTQLSAAFARRPVSPEDRA